MWSVCQLKPTPDAAAVAIVNLERQGFAAFNPTFSACRIRRNKLRLEQQQVFPGYLFIELHNGQRWSPVNSTYGVARLLVRNAPDGLYNAPAIIADSFIEQLQRCSHKDDRNSWCLRPGTEVRIATGPFAGRDAIVTWSSAERVRLLVWLLGRDVAVTLATTDVVAQA